jgi:Bacterial RNA polymerase, alpha chain C terminal domain
MPISSPRNPPARTVRELGLPARAVTALTRAGVTTVEDLAVLTRRDLVAIDGLGPGMVAAIRAVVPEPSHRIPPEDGEAPAAPVMPSFESLRGPRRRSAVDDLLVPAPPRATSEPAATPRLRPPPRPTSSGRPRPAEYADLWRLGVRVARGVACVPVRLLTWSVREPVRRVRGLLRG